jgi:uncharacterized protein YjiS (DUF1127 family)
MTLTATHQPACLPTTGQAIGFIATLRNMVAIARQRRALRQLEDHLLEDIGIDRDQALTEAQRPVWDVPVFWRK